MSRLVLNHKMMKYSKIWGKDTKNVLATKLFLGPLRQASGQKPCFLGPIKLLIHDLTDIRLRVCNCRSVHKVTHLGVLQQVKCWKKKLKITSCHSGHFTIGCSWFPDRLRKGLWHSAWNFWLQIFSVFQMLYWIWNFCKDKHQAKRHKNVLFRKRHNFYSLKV